MRKVFLVFSSLLFLFLFLSFSKKNVYATDFPTDKLGIDCGVAGVSGINKCCTKSGKSNFNLGIPGSGFLMNNIPGLKKEAEKVKNLDNNIPATPCIIGKPTTRDYSSPSCKCVLSEGGKAGGVTITSLCKKYMTGSSSKNLKLCINCARAGGYLSELGCIPLQINSFLSDWLLSIGIGLAGLVSLLCIIYSSIIIQTSQGDAQKIKKGKEMMTSCLIGLIVVIFSVFILRVVGVDILRIPGMR